MGSGMRIYLAAVLLFFVLLRCQDPVEGEFCQDPLGSEDQIFGDGTFFCFKESLDGCFVVMVISDRVFFSSIDFGGEIGSVADAGIVKCLGEITEKPLSGYVQQIEVFERQGYVFLFPDETYGRIYIDSIQETPEGKRINILRQYAF